MEIMNQKNKTSPTEAVAIAAMSDTGDGTFGC